MQYRSDLTLELGQKEYQPLNNFVDKVGVEVGKRTIFRDTGESRHVFYEDVIIYCDVAYGQVDV